MPETQFRIRQLVGIFHPELVRRDRFPMMNGMRRSHEEMHIIDIILPCQLKRHYYVDDRMLKTHLVVECPLETIIAMVEIARKQDSR